MRPPHDDFDDLDIDFGDNATARRLLREMIHEQRRLASRRVSGPRSKREHREFDDDYDYDDEDDYEEYEDYDDDEFDSYSDTRFN